MNKEELYTFEDKTSDEVLLINGFTHINQLIPYVNRLQQENEKLHHYKTLYQSLKKQKEELRSWLKEDNDKIKVYDTKNDKAVELGIVLGLGMCVEKLEELEGVNDE